VGLQERWKDPRTDLTEDMVKTRMAGYDRALEQACDRKRALVNVEKVKDTTAATYTKSGDTVYMSANQVASRSGKNRLYLGNRQEVAIFAKSSEDADNKQKRILDANVWSWDVNFAWLEGGINARACFKLKSALPESVQQSDLDDQCRPVQGALREIRAGSGERALGSVA
jgi:hypothetical protein